MDANTLVVLLHAYTSSPERMKSVQDVVRRTYPIHEILCPVLPLSLFSHADPISIVSHVLREIDQIWKVATHERIVLVGHSVGALLARKVYVAACGEHELAPLEDGLVGCAVARPWAAKVERIILLAGMNRGWAISHHMSLKRSLSLMVGSGLAVLLPGQLAIFQFRRGAPFITQLRIQWLRMRQRAKSKPGTATKELWPGSATTIQLLGTIDDVVSPDDNVDLIAGLDFHYLDVPHSGHGNVIEMTDPKRAAVLEDALRFRANTESTSSDAASVIGKNEPWDLDLTPQVRSDVTDVVFVMHGIRDEGHWTNRIAREVLKHASNTQNQPSQTGRTQRVFATETSTYGFFGMGPFLIPNQRRKRVEWFMDQYAEAVAHYPSASRYYYMGHSHGTYLLTKALEQYPCCRFERVVFAGSVAHTSYDWGSLQSGQKSRVGQVLNLTGAQDWVVAYFPRLLEKLRLQDVGGAGFEGFTSASENGPVFQRRLQGGHSIGIQEDAWPAIARFLLDGTIPDYQHLPREDHKPWLYSKIVSHQPALAWIAILLIAAALFIGMYGFTRHWPIIAAGALFSAVMVRVLTKV